MKKILIYEYITGGGLLNEDLTSNLMFEARMILSSLIDSCNRSNKYDYRYFLDHRLTGMHSDKSIVTHETKDLYNLNLIKKFDYVLPIIPEINLDLLMYVKYLEKNKINKIISNSKTIEICSDKMKFYRYLNKYNLPIIPTYCSLNSKSNSKKYILKDKYGAGCSYVRIANKKDLKHHYSKDKVIQPFIDGDNYSLSVFFGTDDYRLLTINQQHFDINNDMIKLRGLTINIHHKLYLNILSAISEIQECLPGLYGFIGIDILLKDKQIFIVEINPRITTSYVGLNKTIGCNMIDLISNYNYIKNVITSKKYYIENNK